MLGGGGVAACEVDVAGDDVSVAADRIGFERGLGSARRGFVEAGVEFEPGEAGERAGVCGVAGEGLADQLARAGDVAEELAGAGAEDESLGRRAGALHGDQAMRPGVVELALGGEHRGGDLVDEGVVAVEAERGADLDAGGGEAAGVEQVVGEGGVGAGVIGVEGQCAAQEIDAAAVVAEPALDIGLGEQDGDLMRVAHRAPETTMSQRSLSTRPSTVPRRRKPAMMTNRELRTGPP